MLGDLITAVIGVTLGVAFFPEGLPGRSFLLIAIDEGRPVGERVNDVLHIGAGDRLAEIIFGFERGFDEVSLKNARGGSRHFDFVLGLFILLHIEAAIDGVTLASAAADVIE